MKKKLNVMAKAPCIAALLLVACVCITVPALAFRNPDQEPQGYSEAPGFSSAGRNNAAAPADAGAVTKSSTGADSGSTAAGIMAADEVGLASPAAAALSKACGFDAFNASQQNRWQATFSTRTGTVKRLYGAAAEPCGGSPENNARAFLESAGTIFGLKSGLPDLATQAVDQSAERYHVRLQQTCNGVPVIGAEVRVHSDLKGRVTMVQNGYVNNLVIVNRDTLSVEDARSMAVRDLQDRLPDAEFSEPAAEKIIAPHKGAYAYFWKVSIPCTQPLALWVYRIDAASGVIVYRANENLYLDNGAGRAYLNNDDRLINKITNVRLEDIYTTDDGKPEGLLYGLRTSIYDYLGDYAFEPSLKFIYDVSIDKVFFDQAHAYYQMTTIWEWWDKNVIKKYGPRNIRHFYTLSVPTFVNATDFVSCNAFYSTAITNDPGLGLIPGFAFGDDNTCPWLNEDFIIDNDVVRHEYAHAIMDWAGFFTDEGQFGGPVNAYGRAMGEGNSDWYAFLASGKPGLGYVAFYPFGLRNIDNINMYPYDVDDPDYLSDSVTACTEPTPLPEEHYTGQIWGGYLYDLSRILKKSALKYVYTSSFYFSTAGGHRDGYADFVDAVRAQFDAELDMTGNNKKSLKAYGSMASRGFTRALLGLYSHPCDYFGTALPGEDSRDYVSLNAPLKLKTEANILSSGDQHEYPLYANAGMLLTASVKSKKGGLRAPAIELYSIDGTPLKSVDFSGNMSVTRAVLNYTVSESGMYVVRVSGMNSSPARGYYTLQLTVE